MDRRKTYFLFIYLKNFVLCCKSNTTLPFDASAFILQNTKPFTFNFSSRLLAAGLQSGEYIKWVEALQSEHVLCQILWIAENTLNHQLLEKVINTWCQSRVVSTFLFFMEVTMCEVTRLCQMLVIEYMH